MTRHRLPPMPGRGRGSLERYLAGQPAPALELRQASTCEVPARWRNSPCKRTGAAGLTGREAEVLRLVAQGLSNGQIAARLFVSEHTVRRHVTSILRKLKLTSRTAAAAYAFRHNLL